MPVYDDATTSYTAGIADAFTAANMKYWVPAVLGVLVLLFIIYKYVYSGKAPVSLKRY